MVFGGLRSIPASAGEPVFGIGWRAGAQVYPRECGGTADRMVRPVSLTGLSPRVRGNPIARSEILGCHGSIPASAGEPCEFKGAKVLNAVYPRECGGTIQAARCCLPSGGLSPRVRGNRLPALVTSTRAGSIPASAGEPRAAGVLACAVGVYPRECGGTMTVYIVIRNPPGLSPRVRGTRLPRCLMSSPQGLSPRVRGNPVSSLTNTTPRRSIPRVRGNRTLP